MVKPEEKLIFANSTLIFHLQLKYSTWSVTNSELTSRIVEFMYNGVIRKNGLSKHHYTKSAHSFGESQNVLVMGAPFEHFSSKPTTQYATNTESSTGHSRSPNKQKIDDSITEWLKINE